MKKNRDDNPKPALKRAAMLRPIQYRVNELEYVLGAGETKIRQWIEDKKLPSYRIDGTIYVHRIDAFAFVEKYREQQNVNDYKIGG
ncbi:MAG: helix-turn-helix domain-containing protein [Planctomycetota bacterium]|nr:helix-turn-helix domain-containing protein [Planctomycetota bacterium]